LGAAGQVSRDLYAQVVVLVLVTTLLTPLLLRFAFPLFAPAKVCSDGTEAVLEKLPEPATNLVDAESVINGPRMTRLIINCRPD
jgi:hypothetical protein